MILRGILETSSEKFWMKIGKVVVLGEVKITVKVLGKTVKKHFTKGLNETYSDFYSRVMRDLYDFDIRKMGY